MLERMSERDRRALFLVGAFLITIVLYTQAIEPLVFRFQDAMGRLQRSEQLSAGYLQKIRMLPRREARLAELEQEKSAVDTYFKASPASRSAPAETLIDELSSYASITGVTMLQLIPNVAGRLSCTTPISVSAGNFTPQVSIGRVRTESTQRRCASKQRARSGPR